jgi:hypothetical protein
VKRIAKIQHMGEPAEEKKMGGWWEERVLMARGNVLSPFQVTGLGFRSLEKQMLSSYRGHW